MLYAQQTSGNPHNTAHFIDIANLTHESFNKDLNKVLDRAEKFGIKKIIITGACPHSNEQAVKLTEQFAEHKVQLSTTAGVHPHEAKQFNQEVAQNITGLSQIDVVKAIGETGLDFYRDLSPRPVQEQVFINQLAIAAETGLPVFLHERNAHQRFFAILKDYRDHLHKVIVHCFTGDKKSLFNYLDIDCFIGLTGWICDERRGSHLLPLIPNIPLNRLLIETDAPYLMPRTLHIKPRTRRNEPMFLSEVFNLIKQHQDGNTQIIMQQLYDNANSFFNLGDE